MRPTVLLASCLALASLSSVAYGQPADATKLFDQGKALFDAKKYAEACDILAQSNRAAHAVGTLGLLAACHEKINKRAAAYREYLDAADLARQLNDPRESFARDQANLLAKSIAWVTARPAEPTPGLSLVVDDEPFASDQPFAVDPGKHEVAARAPGRREVRASFEIAATQKLSLPLPALPLTAGAGEPPVVAPPGALSNATSNGDGSPDTTTKSSSPLLPVGLVAIGAGVIGVGFGIGLGVGAIGKKNDLGCDANNVCAKDPQGVNDYATLRTGSTIGFWAGGVVAAAGVVMVVLAPSRSNARTGSARVSPYVSPLGAGLRGTF